MELNLHLAKLETENWDGLEKEIIFKALRVPEILEVIFKYVDTERLKRFRGVCLGWSNEISRLFHTRVLPVVSYADWSKFQKQLEKGKSGRLLSPFQEMDATIKFGILEPRSLHRLKSPLPITRLNLHDKAVHRKAGANPGLSKYVLRILQSCSETLTHLKTPFWTLPEEMSTAPSFQLPQLRTLVANGYESSRELRQQETQSNFSLPEFNFFLLIISSAPQLSSLTFESLSAFSELLRRASFKRIENLNLWVVPRISDRDTWERLIQIDIQALKSFTTHFYFEHAWFRERELFISRFSHSLQVLRFELTLCRPPVCPLVRTLHIRIEMPIDLSLFPSLKQVVITGDAVGINRFSQNRSYVKPCPTVLDVCIDGVFTKEASNPIAVIQRVLRLFPSATFWRVNYLAVRYFCKTVADSQVRIERLRVNLNCLNSEHCTHPSRSKAKKAFGMDLWTFSKLRLLADLRELDLSQDLRCHFTCPWKRLLPLNLGAIRFRNLGQLRTLRIYAAEHQFRDSLVFYTDSHELPPELLSLQHLDIAVELIVPSLLGSRNWSDSLMPMKNLTMFCENRDFVI